MTSSNLFDLTGRVAIVTGGSRGLGRQMCLAFAANGATVVVTSRKVEQCIAVVSEIEAKYGTEAAAIACHVGDWDQCTNLIADVQARFGKIDILVNNAGMSPLYTSLAEVGESLFDKVIDVNLKGPFRLSALAAESMMATGGGSIINVSSTSSIQPSAAEVPYAMAKAGLNTLTVALAHMFGPTVRANGIMPGPFLTDISDAWDMDAFEKNAERTIPLQRGGKPEEIAGAALYLASDASSYTTGAIIKADGGMAWAPA